MTTCELRLKAAEIIEKGGHQKGAMRLDGAHCLLGALADAKGRTHIITDDALRDADIQRACQAMGFTGGPDEAARDAYIWNDDTSTTTEQVLARLRDGCEAPR